MLSINGMELIATGWIHLQHEGITARQQAKAYALIDRGNRICEVERALFAIHMRHELQRKVRPLMSRILMLEYSSRRQLHTVAGLLRSLFRPAGMSEFERTIVGRVVAVVDDQGYVVDCHELRAVDIEATTFDLDRYSLTIMRRSNELIVETFSWK